jgi:hypothetical protein
MVGFGIRQQYPSRQKLTIRVYAQLRKRDELGSGLLRSSPLSLVPAPNSAETFTPNYSESHK